MPDGLSDHPDGDLLGPSTIIDVVHQEVERLVAAQRQRALSILADASEAQLTRLGLAVVDPDDLTGLVDDNPPLNDSEEARAEWKQAQAEILRFLEELTRDVPQVVHCRTVALNPDSPKQNQFRNGAKGIEETFSNGTYSVKFGVETSAKKTGEQNAVVVVLNEWLDARR